MSALAPSVGMFHRLLDKPPLWRNKEVLRPTFVPDTLPARSAQMDRLGTLLLPTLRGQKAGNIFITGPSGSGKTAAVRLIGNELTKEAKERELPVEFLYVDCAVVDTPYRVLTRVANHFISNWHDHLPSTGWLTDDVIANLTSTLNKRGGTVVLVLDNLDHLINKAGDTILSKLLRIEDDFKNGALNIIGIARNAKCLDYVDPRLKTDFFTDSVDFPGFTQDEILGILQDRVALAFQLGMVDEGSLVAGARVAAEGLGGARKALDTLLVAGELSERDGHRITSLHMQQAAMRMAGDRARMVIRGFDVQTKLVLLSAVKAARNTMNVVTGVVYDEYRHVSIKAATPTLTCRRVTDLLTNLDVAGILTCKVVSKGRGGRTKTVHLLTDADVITSVLMEDPLLAGAL